MGAPTSTARVGIAFRLATVVQKNDYRIWPARRLEMYGNLAILRGVNAWSTRVLRQCPDEPFRLRLRGGIDGRQVLLRDFVVDSRQRRQCIGKPGRLRTMRQRIHPRERQSRIVGIGPSKSAQRHDLGCFLHRLSSRPKRYRAGVSRKTPCTGIDRGLTRRTAPPLCGNHHMSSHCSPTNRSASLSARSSSCSCASKSAGSGDAI